MSLLIAVLLAVPMSTTPQAPMSTQEMQLAQSLGFNCRTEFGVCPIQPHPLSSVCYCGAPQGVVIE